MGEASSGAGEGAVAGERAGTNEWAGADEPAGPDEWSGRFEQQAAACDDLGSPLWARLLRIVAADVRAEGPSWSVLRERAGLRFGQAGPLRLVGAAHRLALLQLRSDRVMAGREAFPRQLGPIRPALAPTENDPRRALGEALPPFVVVVKQVHRQLGAVQLVAQADPRRRRA